MDIGTVKRITLVFGIIYALMGVMGFIPGLTSPADTPGNMPNEGLVLGLFAVNVLHNLSHILFGAILIYGGLSDQVFMVNRIMCVVFLALVVASVIQPLVDLVSVNIADTLLHLASAALTGFLGFIAPRGRVASRT